MLKKAFIIITIVIFAAAFVFAESVGDTAPDLNVKDYNGNSQSISKYRGKVVLLKFWASWCGPCVRSLPKTNTLYKKYENRGLVVFAVGLGGESRDKKMLQSKGYRFHVMVDGRKYRSQIQRNYNFRGIPHELLISRSGKILFKGHPARLKDSLIRKALNESGGSGVSQPDNPPVPVSPESNTEESDKEKIKYLITTVKESINKWADYKGSAKKYKRYVDFYVNKMKNYRYARYALNYMEKYISWSIYKSKWQIIRIKWRRQLYKAKDYKDFVKPIMTLMNNISYKKGVNKRIWKQRRKKFKQYVDYFRKKK